MSKEMVMVSAAPLTIVGHPSHQRSSPLKKACAFIAVAELALHPKKNAIMFAKKEEKVSYSLEAWRSLLIRTLSLT